MGYDDAAQDLLEEMPDARDDGHRLAQRGKLTAFDRLIQPFDELRRLFQTQQQQGDRRDDGRDRDEDRGQPRRQSPTIARPSHDAAVNRIRGTRENDRPGNRNEEGSKNQDELDEDEQEQEEEDRQEEVPASHEPGIRAPSLGRAVQRTRASSATSAFSLIRAITSS